MTEAEWLECNDPTPMLEFLRGKVSERKLRLFACACARRVAHLFTDKRSLRAVELSELYADGLASEKDKNQAGHDAYDATAASQLAADSAAYHAGYCDGYNDVRRVVQDTLSVKVTSDSPSQDHEPVAHCSLLRCIFGNLFRPVTLNPACRTENVVAITQSIYDNRRFMDMPILADALEDAGCDNADILTHCRSGGEHVRGCFVVDAVLGKE